MHYILTAAMAYVQDDIEATVFVQTRKFLHKMPFTVEKATGMFEHFANKSTDCWTCKSMPGRFSCQTCGGAKYCSRECQLTHWNQEHKKYCKG